MHRFFFTNREWPAAVGRALSDMVQLPTSGDVDDIDFELGPPSRGLCPCRIVINGKRRPLCGVCDTFPVLERLRSWLERCLVFDRYGVLHPEILTVDCREGVLSAVLVHAGWEAEEKCEGSRPVSLLVLHMSGQREPFYCGFCDTFATVARLYRRVISLIHTWRDRFDAPPGWFSPRQLRRLDARPWSEVMLETFRSSAIEEKTIFFRKNVD